MNAKILSILFILFVGIGFSSCSKDKNESSFDSGKNQGAKFREAALGYYANPVDMVKLGILYSTYQSYQQNSSDPEWKKGFLSGATNSDESKYAELANLLDQDLDFSVQNGLEAVSKLINLLN